MKSKALAAPAEDEFEIAFRQLSAAMQPWFELLIIDAPVAHRRVDVIC